MISKARTVGETAVLPNALAIVEERNRLRAERDEWRRNVASALTQLIQEVHRLTYVPRWNCDLKVIREPLTGEEGDNV